VCVAHVASSREFVRDSCTFSKTLLQTDILLSERTSFVHRS